MSKQTLKIQFKKSNIENLSEFTEAVIQSTNEAIAENARKFQEEEITRLKLNNAPYHGPEGDRVINRINVWLSPDHKAVTVSNTSPHAVWVEFGTGVKGAESKAMLPKQTRGMYKSKGDGKGWVLYFPKKILVKKRTRADGGETWGLSNFATTHGMPSRPFMFNTYNRLQLMMRQINKGDWFGRGKNMRLIRILLARGWRIK